MPVFILIFLLLMIAYAILIDYYRRAWNNIPRFSAGSTPSTRLSVIIAVRNEADNIPQLLQSLEAQSYPKELFEIIIGNDYSTDNSWQLLADYQGTLTTRFFQLADHIDNDATSAHKKKIIETGVGMATGELIVTTDADCLFHPNWLYTIAAFYEASQAKFIAAPVKISGHASLLSVFQTLDFITLQGITGASVYKRIHSMCNGANLAYPKKVFEEVNGYRNIDHIPSGDDMFLMHKIYSKYPQQVFYLKHAEAIVSTAPVKSLQAFFNQRIRWASKADKYDDKRIFRVLLFVYLLNIFFLALGIACFFKASWLFFFCLFLLAKVLIEFPFVNAVAVFFQQQKLMAYFIAMQPLHILYTIIAGWLGKFGSFEWKGRVIKKLK